MARDKAGKFHVASNSNRTDLFNLYCKEINRTEALEDVLKEILQAHEMSAVDWPAMRHAKRILGEV